jgi:hypothetical protein
MKEKLFLSGGISALVLVFGMLVVGCENGGDESNDTWSKVISLSQINGTWKAVLSGGSRELQGEGFDGITMTDITEATVTINASEQTQSMMEKSTATFSGGNIAQMWDTIKRNMENYEGGAVTFDDARYSITTIQDTPSQPLSITESDLKDSGLEINQNGTKLKGTQTSGDETREVIYIKQ